MTIGKTCIALLMLGALTLAHGTAQAACPTGPNDTLGDFPAYKYELKASHAKALDALAGKVLALTKSGKPVRKIRIVGHAATWGKEDYQKLSEYRALVVSAELTSRFAALGIKSDKAEITTEGFSDRCPVATNSTQAGRAKNRRVEVWITAAPKPTPPPPPVKEKTHTEHLRLLKASTKNPTTECLITKLLAPTTNSTFLPVDGLTTYMQQTIQKTGLHGYTSFERNLKSFMHTQLLRIQKVETKESDEKRYAARFLSQQEALIDGVRALHYLDCYDKRSKIVRNHIIALSKKSTSLYSCPVIKALVAESTKSACTA